MASPALSQASTAFENDAPQGHDDHKDIKKATLQRAKEAATSRDILLFLIAFRILNALSIRTFFQPDEYYQSLEPAWKIAFGPNSGAWITWEWRNQLRSAIHPAIFAAVYCLSAQLSELLQFSPHVRDELFLAAPKVTQAVIAALGDYYTWRLGDRVYGNASNEAWAALFLTVTSPWQWFCSTRTLSNCLETTLTIIALHQWPWHWSLDATGDEPVDKYGLREDQKPDQAEELAKCVLESDESGAGKRSMAYRLCRCLLLAALACVLRPTNVLIWICLSCFSLWKSSASGKLLKLPWTTGNLWIHITSAAHGPATRRERMFLVLEAAICGSIVLTISATADRLYYQQWTFPPLRFLYFNLARSLSVHYGRNDWHYYLSQGYPLLLTTFLPFAIVGLYQSLFPQGPPSSNQTLLTTTIKRQLATTSLLVPFILSFISHKEVRFIYPLLPPLHILSASPFTTYFLPLLSPSPTPPPRQITRTSPPTSKAATKRLLLLTTLLTTNLLLSYLTTQAHQPAPLTTLTYLRSRASSSSHNNPITISFLTPCHSTPWRSHLLRSPLTLKAWALPCEPPLHLPSSQHPAYKDEADEFYASPANWIKRHLGRPPKSLTEQRARMGALESVGGVGWDGDVAGVGEQQLGGGEVAGVFGGKGREGGRKDKGREGGRKDKGKGVRKRVWTAYLVFFGQLEGEMRGVLRGSGYGVCWRGWNGWGNEDWRRRGGMVVWCLDEGEKARWKEEEERIEAEGREGWKGWRRLVEW